ncbi:MAG: hypothetical protein HYW90_02600 [Candidatus Sungbacteria bacterium]|nr:hypothetical protein [Candidatus Sungbacteria bacterium]
MFRHGIEYPLDEDLKALVKKLEEDKKFKIVKRGSGQDYTVMYKILNAD